VSAALEVTDLTVRFGGVVAVDGVSLSVPAGRVVGLIGPNGAGKTSLVDAVTGLGPRASGRVLLAGRPVEHLTAHRRARLGLRRTFQSLRLFEDLTVTEQLAVAGDGAARRDGPTAALVERMALGEVAGVVPLGLPTDVRGRVSLARALAADPAVVLLDEPAAGLDPAGRAELAGRLRALADGGLAVVLVEHDLELVFSVCDEVVVLDHGRVLASGPPRSVRDDPAVRAAYFGGGTSLAVRPGAAEPEGPSADRPPAADHPAAPALEVEGLTAGYGGAPVVADVGLRVGPGEIVALLGLNGAGKTTTLDAVAGVLAPLAGEVRLGGEAVPPRPEVLARRGLALVPARRALFCELTVAENLRLAAPEGAAGLPDGFEVLRPLLARRAGLLSGGETRLVAVARALLRRPRVLLVDELSLGLAPVAVAGLLDALGAAARGGTAVLVVEQHVATALDLADRVYVLDRGRIRGGGPADDTDVSTLLR